MKIRVILNGRGGELDRQTIDVGDADEAVLANARERHRQELLARQQRRAAAND